MRSGLQMLVVITLLIAHGAVPRVFNFVLNVFISQSFHLELELSVDRVQV